MKGIYFIEINDKKYIGQSTNIENRLSEHLNALRKNKHHSWKLQKAFNEFGEDKLISGILEETNNLNDRELYWSNFFDSVKNGYNVSECGKQHMPWTELNKKVYLYDEKGNYLNKEYNSARECSRDLDIDQSLMNKILNNYKDKHTATSKKDNKIYRFSYIKLDKLPELSLHNKSIVVCQYDLNHNFIKEYPSIRQAARELNFSSSCLNSCLNKTHISHGFYWEIKEN